MKYRAIVFDWDGTLVDSTARIVESMQCALKDVGLAWRTAHEVKQIIGLGLPEAIVDLWPELTLESLEVQQMRERYNYHFVSPQRSEINFFDFASEMLAALKDLGFVLAVATGKSRAGLDRAFEELNVGHYFADSRCADETRSKPSPVMLNELSESLGVAPEAMLMVGDTQFDLDMAHAAGVDSLALAHGAHERQKLLESKPLAVVDDLPAFFDWLKA